MTEKMAYVKPIPYFVVEQGAGMYYEMDIDFWLSALYRDLKAYITSGWSKHERSHWDDIIDEDIKYYPILYAFLVNNNSRFVENYEKSMRKKK